jgi:hypothetical protein
MQPSARHQTAETRFRELVTSAGLEQPDGVDYEPDALVFRWSGPKVAVVVDLEHGPSGISVPVKGTQVPLGRPSGI